MPGTKMPQPQMFVVPEEACWACNYVTTTNLELKAFAPARDKGTSSCTATELLILRLGRPESFVFQENSGERDRTGLGADDLT